MPDKIYIIQKGDTLAKLAQRYYGNPARYKELFDYNRSRLKSKTPDIIFPGETIVIPDKNENDTPIVLDKNINDDHVVMTVGDKQYYDFEEIKISRNIDTVADSFSLFTPAENDSIKLKPFGYEKVKISIGNQKTLTGRSEILIPKTGNTGEGLTIIGRSMPGLLVDCSSTIRPYEYKNLTLDKITEKVLNEFSLKAKFTDDPGTKFEKAVMRHGEKVFTFLARLAGQRGLLVSSDIDGNVLFHRANCNSGPVANLVEGEGNFLASNAVYDGTKRFSDITVDGQMREGKGNNQAIANDKLVMNAPINRPLVLPSWVTAEGSDLNTIAKWERGKQAGESGVVSILVDGWKRLSDKKIWMENETVIVKSPSIRIYKPTKMLIKALNYIRSVGGTYTELYLVFENAYTLDEVEAEPWLN